MTAATTTTTTVSARLAPQPGELIDRSRLLEFRWNGKPCTAHPGDTIASALAAAGERVLSRSYKYHRPRGIQTADFHDPGCMVQVGDEPNVRGAHRLVAEGMEVRSQNTWPSLKYDLKAVNGLVGRFLATGFYYKTFIKPEPLWPMYEKVLRQFVHAGTVSAEPSGAVFDKRYAHPDVVVAGGGPAGMASAVAAARAGAQVMLVEEEHQLGGHLRWGTAADLAALRELRAQVAAEPGIEVLTNSVALARYDDNWIPIVQRGLPHVFERLIKARARSFVVAPGLIERPYVFEGNDLPGVMLSTAVRRLINLYAVRPGQRAVVMSANGSGDAAVEDLRRAGVEIAAVVDARRGEHVVRAEGRGAVRSVTLSDGSQIACDLLVTATGWTAPTSLLNMAGDLPVYDPGSARFVPDPAALPDSVLAAGGVVGDGSSDELVAHGRAVGQEAARRAAHTAGVTRAQLPTRPDQQVGAPADTTATDATATATVGAGAATATAATAGAAAGADLGAGEGYGPRPVPPLRPAPHPELFRSSTHGFVDLCEDVSSKDIVSAVKEGYDSVELVKRYTTVTMGPTQGKLETVNAVAVLAEATGRSIAETGTTTWRPMYAPVTLGALAGRVPEPVRHSPMQPWHERHDAAPLVAGQWIRPEHYGDPAAEVRAVRERVGLIDVTPIGKLDLRGPDVAKLLNLLYVNKWSKLPVGGVRYGVMCADDGVVMDDGVTGRLGEDHYLMSTTSSGAATVWEWVEDWLQTSHPDWQVHVTPVTTAYASMNLAGPRSRELLARVTDVDLGSDAFGYMQVRTGTVAGVADCVLWRIGFTGELSYEIHVPASYGLHVWEHLIEAGHDLGIAAFGVEAQRVLRLEKGHFIVGQDTDGLSQGYTAGLGGLIKLDKPDFVGKPELVWQQEHGDYPVLVAIQPEDSRVVPAEASQIVRADGRIAGRITSSRMSPTLRRSICLGQVDPDLAAPGTRLTVHLPDGADITARVIEGHAHFDPKGERQRA
ncbi:2Fe-2S iron-sulfur cluster-binding protein [Pseudonocardia parietis]|uniref:Sarcosine oxidase subunit alpha n=1 Tax=Pseudonocardia parietis TaxID=570936 RepID=A0ABS4VYG6_9PSEU|nr:2Fe-2S iron-sulfur cluster-binding protein [Pseudonocardia parietis]MBP2368961.1 sarcosine oxidase subunit alpha [Pseudonocardia parietis]